jgi:hypothetical protein
MTGVLKHVESGLLLVKVAGGFRWGRLIDVPEALNAFKTYFRPDC